MFPYAHSPSLCLTLISNIKISKHIPYLRLFTVLVSQKRLMLDIISWNIKRSDFMLINKRLSHNSPYIFNSEAWSHVTIPFLIYRSHYCAYELDARWQWETRHWNLAICGKQISLTDTTYKLSSDISLIDTIYKLSSEIPICGIEKWNKPTTVAVWSKVWNVFGRSNTGIVDSNTTRGVLSVRVYSVRVLTMGWCPVQWVIPTVYEIHASRLILMGTGQRA
jgi:hypothetical protein